MVRGPISFDKQNPLAASASRRPGLHLAGEDGAGVAALPWTGCLDRLVPESDSPFASKIVSEIVARSVADFRVATIEK